jgi:hypothetical protein
MQQPVSCGPMSGLRYQCDTKLLLGYSRLRFEGRRMKRTTLKDRDVSRKEYEVDWAGEKAKVRTKSRLNFIEAQRQILERSRQHKAATGVVIAFFVSIIIWAIIASVAL